MNIRSAAIVGALAAILVAAWPAFMALDHLRSGDLAAPAAASPVWTAAPVTPDYLERDAVVSFYEAAARRDPGDQIIARMLAGEYMQRYRERADVGDLLRARAQTQASLRIQPTLNFGADMQMSSVLAAFHDMRGALAYAREAARIDPSSYAARSTVATLDMELGDYDGALAMLRDRPTRDDPVWDIALVRYDELTGRLAAARSTMVSVAQASDEVVSEPAESRAWSHWREGELAFEAGDLSAAEARYRESLAIFPGYWHGENGLAKVYWAERRWREARDTALAAAESYPLPETLGYAYDAQLALRDRDGAARTLDLIEAIERIGNAQGLSDRLIAMFYADHGLRARDAVAIATRDLRRRDDIYAEDTLAWSLADAGDWNDARVHSARALRLGTEDAKLRYHAGIIDLHCGDRAGGERMLESALALNPAFNPYQADDARRLLGGHNGGT